MHPPADGGIKDHPFQQPENKPRPLVFRNLLIIHFACSDGLNGEVDRLRRESQTKQSEINQKEQQVHHCKEEIFNMKAAADDIQRYPRFTKEERGREREIHQVVW